MSSASPSLQGGNSYKGAQGRAGTSSETLRKVLATGGRGAVDLVTGKANVEYFFDPSLVLEVDKYGDAVAAKGFRKDLNAAFAGEAMADPLLNNSKHLFMPCTIIKSLGTSGGDDTATTTTNATATNTPIAGPTLVKTMDGALHKISDSTLLLRLEEDDYIGVDDVLHLPHVTEASLLHALRLRYKRNDIYTSAGPILISINPYKNVLINGDTESLYSEKRMLLYRKQNSSSNSSDPSNVLPPHLFSIADKAYSAMLESMNVEPSLDADSSSLEQHAPVRNQSIIISGESGAGKTEATKIIMQYLARITKKIGTDDLTTAALLSPDGKAIAALEDKVLSSNPLLETFGNARTLRNDNSSRFGKFIHIYFDASAKAKIKGASISNYLLERTRICTQIEGERNYHIFYQLMAGCSDALLQDFGLVDESNKAIAFTYMASSKKMDKKKKESERQRDIQGFAETKACLARILNLSMEDQNFVFGIVAAVLHLGNIKFEAAPDGDDDHSMAASRVVTPDDTTTNASLEKACKLLGLDAAAVQEAMLTKVLTISGKTIHKPQSVAQAEEKRDALAKMTYSSLFLWLVRRVNETLQVDSVSSNSNNNNNAGGRQQQTGFIGVLDIYGFEVFDQNGFEQLLINYCNEKLQRHFNRHLFEVEQDLYANEGVDWTYITFNDNRPCLELLEGGSGVVGILNMLDDSWGGMGSTAEKDVKFVAQLHKAFGGTKNSNKGKENAAGHDYFITPKFGIDKQFVICHYAGDVKYTASGFVEKNMDTLSNELKDLGTTSTIEVVSTVFDCGMGDYNTANQRSSIRGISVGSQFRASLQSLMADLNATQPHYIRCVKPNLKKAPSSLDSGEVLRQLRYSGMMEAIRIRREGYALREDHTSFFNRFSVLLQPEDVQQQGGGSSGIEQLVRVLSKRLNVTDADWQIGHSKIFLRRELATKLERLARLRVHSAGWTVTRFGRRVAHRRASKLLVAWTRLRLVLIRKHRRTKAANRLAAFYRSYKQRRNFLFIVKYVIKLQAMQRRIGAQSRVRKIRDPYGDMTYNEVKELLASEQERLDGYVKDKMFQAAAKLEPKIDDIKEALESKRPMTRRYLETMIDEVQVELDDAVKRKSYDECGPLQIKLEELTNKRQDYPTMEELKKAIDDEEVLVADAIAKRNFSGAAEGQERVAAAKKRLEDALAAEDAIAAEDAVVEPTPEDTHGFGSRGELDAQIVTVNAEINAAIAKKEFTTASSLQDKLDELEKLRPLFPSIEELEVQLAEAEKKQDEAIANKDYVTAGRLHDVVEALEEKVKAEKERVPENAAITEPEAAEEEDGSASIKTPDGETIVFESRADLDKAIKENTAQVSKTVAAKEFKKAQSLQAFVDELEELKPKLPSLAELNSELMKAKKEMDTAIKQKKFADAESLHEKVDVLEKKVATEKSKMPKPPQAPVAKTPAIASVRPVVSPRAITASVASVAPRTATLSVAGTARTPATARSVGVPPPQIAVGKNSSKPVSKLRPLKPVLVDGDQNMVDVCKVMASKRVRAAIVPGPYGGVGGIITDSDITRRVAAKELVPATTTLSSVMTPNPTCVSVSDSASDALSMMIENRYRHLPVVDDSGNISGLLDIGKCLNDAISKLERTEEKGGSNSSSSALLQAVNLQGGGAAQAAALQALLGPLMAQAMGDKGSPTLRSILAGRPSTIVSPGVTVLEATQKMAENRKAALIVEGGKLVGILSFKDIVSRLIAKEKLLDETEVSTVMTPNPESMLPDATVLEALQTMHDHNFLTLPVCEASGQVVGLVDVMDVIYGCGGAEGWRSIFDSAMDYSDDMSEVSGSQSLAVSSRGVLALTSGASVMSNAEPIKEKKERPVSKLRPKKPLISSEQDSILAVTQMLANKRGDASLVVSSAGGLAGIITDTDITRRVVAKSLDPGSTSIADVMTPEPTCVHMKDPAIDALGIMVENHFRHLPVIDEHGAVVGLLDIAKCLNDAINKLEKADNKSSSAADNAVKQMAGLQGAGGAQAAALQALLGPLMAQAFGGQASPKLRALLAGKPATIVSPSTSLRNAGLLMAERRKAALVVDGRKMVGIFGFKDMMSRAVAKELPLDLTEVSAVMTPNPEAVSPEMTVLEALQTMHDHKFLTLPVCEDDGTVVGLVDVMDLIYGCGGAEGWRSIFSSAMELDDVSDVASVYSTESATRTVASRAASVKKTDMRAVSKLRPKKPLISTEQDSILSVTQMLANKRGAASLVVNAAGGLAGIITDTDITRRVVAKYVEAGAAAISEVMTPNPKCVNMTDPAMDALTTMVENHFRHLPVIDESGAVVGLLDIAKCLNDAIDKLERVKDKSSSAAEDAVKQVAGLQGAGGAQAAALQALLGPLMAQAFGGQASPKLRTLLAGKPATIVEPSTSIRDAGLLMAERRKAALVVENGRLVGLFGFKDMMTRAVAKELDIDYTEVSQVMTPNPDSVSPEVTVLEALQMMHDNKFLTLPVCEADGRVIGLVDVMDVINGCGGAEGWRSVFSSMMEMDDGSDMQSVQSHDSGRGSVALIGSSPSVKNQTDQRPVSKLRPKKPFLINKIETVLSCAKELTAKRGTAAVVIDDTATLVGIITDTDITRRVAAKRLNPEITALSAVMTPNPTCVAMADSAMDALSMMIENRYRHLPVVDDRGSICGVLDIGKCLNDAITKLEHKKEKTSNAANDALLAAVNVQGGGGGAQAAALQALLGPLMAQAVGDQASPTLRSVLAGKPSTIVFPDDTVQTAAERMADSRKAALIVEGDQLVGILSFKDVMSRVIAKDLPLDTTLVASVMTPDPEALLPDQTVLEALQVMHDNKFLTLPVCEEDGRVVGLVDVMDVIYGCGGAEGWRSIFNSAIELDDASMSAASERQDDVGPMALTVSPFNRKNNQIIMSSESALGNFVPRNIEIQEADNFSIDFSVRGGVVYKVTDPKGNTHRIRCEPRRKKLLDNLLPKMGKELEPDTLTIQFVDDEGDSVLITNDEDLMEATELAHKAGNQIVKLTVSRLREKNPLENPAVLGAIGVGVVAVLAIVTILLKPSKR